MPWPLEIYQACQLFNCLPFPGALFDQPPMLMQAIRVCLSVKRTAEKESKHFDEVDTRIKRIVDILKMGGLDSERYRHRLRMVCGPGILDGNGRPNAKEFERLGLELVWWDVIGKLRG